jgi:hypothetical protein
MDNFGHVECINGHLTYCSTWDFRRIDSLILEFAKNFAAELGVNLQSIGS